MYRNVSDKKMELYMCNSKKMELYMYNSKKVELYMYNSKKMELDMYNSKELYMYNSKELYIPVHSYTFHIFRRFWGKGFWKSIVFFGFCLTKKMRPHGLQLLKSNRSHML